MLDNSSPQMGITLHYLLLFEIATLSDVILITIDSHSNWSNPGELIEQNPIIERQGINAPTQI